ncbi:hypothetical protein HPB52_023320 [Rhipicephalus sanguineus]|uniref:Uncharacterized protein n=1 Tax=Rhipicephalus sanguineus TaxID=34632 RepID=A0A9D4QB43_RHISA|nr:hypothetical protein HPB52_023320 [Rhipicephalus sanguineus]
MADHFDEDWQEVPPDEDECDEAAQNEEPFQGSSQEMTSLTSFHRVRRAAHTLQLAVNAGLREDEHAKELLELINSTANVFRRSSLWTERLKALCAKDSIPHAGTGWNSLVTALKRLTEHFVVVVRCPSPPVTLDRLGVRNARDHAYVAKRVSLNVYSSTDAKDEKCIPALPSLELRP